MFVTIFVFFSTRTTPLICRRLRLLNFLTKVYTVTVLAPYIACTVSILLHIIIILAYATKFGKMQESNWRSERGDDGGLCRERGP